MKESNLIQVWLSEQEKGEGGVGRALYCPYPLPRWYGG